jgi:hypothetical protein
MAENAQDKTQTVSFLNNASFLLVMLDVKIGCLSIIDIYSGDGIKVITDSFHGVSEYHKQNCTVRIRQKKKGKLGFCLPFFEYRCFMCVFLSILHYNSSRRS